MSLNPRTHIKKLGRGGLICNPRAGRGGRGNHWGLLASQDSLLCKFLVSMGPGLEEQDPMAPEKPHSGSISGLHTCAHGHTYKPKSDFTPTPHRLSLSPSLPPFFSFTLPLFPSFLLVLLVILRKPSLLIHTLLLITQYHRLGTA